MISSMNKKLLLLNCLMSGVIIGAENLGQHNCHVMIVKDREEIKQGSIHTLMFFRKGDYDKFLFTSDYFNRPIKSTNWDIEKQGVLHVHFKDGTNLEIDVNKPFKN